MSHAQTENESESLFTLRLSKGFTDPLRTRILSECGVAPISPRSFREEFGGPSLAVVLKAFELLEQFGWLEKLPVEPGESVSDPLDRRYGLAIETVFDDPVWAEFPPSTRALVSWRIFETLTARVKDAMKTGSMHTREDPHLTWRPLELDQQGWQAVMDRLRATFFFLDEEQEEADRRMAESGEEPVPMTVALLGFESPKRGLKRR